MLPSPISGHQRIHVLDCRGQKAAAEWRVRHIANAEFAAGRQDFRLYIATPQRIFGFDRDDRMHCVRATNGRRAGLGQCEITHLALFDKTLHRADGVFDWHRCIHPMQPVNIDDINAQPFQAGLVRQRTYKAGVVLHSFDSHSVFGVLELIQRMKKMLVAAAIPWLTEQCMDADARGCQ